MSHPTHDPWWHIVADAILTMDSPVNGIHHWANRAYSHLNEIDIFRVPGGWFQEQSV